MSFRQIVSDISASRLFGWLIANQLQLSIATMVILQVVTVIAVLSAGRNAEDASYSAEEAYRSARSAEHAAQQAVQELDGLSRNIR